MSKTKQEIEKLHALFLSQEPTNWELAAAMCSEADFEAVIDMEVERLINGCDYKIVVRKDPTISPRTQVLYKYNIMLGGRYETIIFSWVSIYTGGCMAGIGSRFIFPRGFRVFSEAEYHEDFAAENPFRTYSTTGIVCADNEHIEKSFAAELEAVKKYWRGVFKELKQ